MILVDTSVWVAHLRHGNVRLAGLLDDGRVLCHPFIIGELACGNLSNRSEILSLHLGDAERMFFVSLLLSQTLGWMRTQTGTTSLRAILYMDEIAGYLPPVASRPSKAPLLTLLKQGRAFGLCVVLATQNPVDLDYKALANPGTWFLGRLQTERDKARVIEGLEGVAATGGRAFDRAKMEAILAALGRRVFLMNNVHDERPEIFETRWTLSYLRGPLTLPEIGKLMAPRRQEAAAASEAATAPTRPAAAAVAHRQLVPVGIGEVFLAARPGTGPIRYRPRIAAVARLHYVDAKSALDAWAGS